MRCVNSIVMGGIALIALTAGRDALSASAAQGPMVLTPPGITVQDIRSQASERYGAKPETREKEAFEGQQKPKPFLPARGRARGGDLGYTYANEKGLALYTYDKDTEKGKSACYDACTALWKPAIAPKGTKTMGPWSTIKRTDGSIQWTFQGKPLYTYDHDTKIGEKRGDGVDNLWRNAKFEPTKGLEVPNGIGIGESDVANGFVLTDHRRMTLYTFDGNAAKNQQACVTSACPDHWIAVSAGTLANPKGEFSLVTGADGTRQWAFRGKPLYTYGGDYAVGDVNGAGIDKKYQVAVVAKHFIPATASVRMDIARGPLIATAAGMTIYRRDTSYHQPDGHGLPGSSPGDQAVGREMGTRSCVKECLTRFKPFVPAANELPSGFWDILTRDDGTRQWAYKGFAAYTYVGDTKPGDKTANDIYDILVDGDLNRDIYETGVVKNTDSAAMLWAYIEP